LKVSEEQVVLLEPEELIMLRYQCAERQILAYQIRGRLSEKKEDQRICKPTAGHVLFDSAPQAPLGRVNLAMFFGRTLLLPLSTAQ